MDNFSRLSRTILKELHSRNVVDSFDNLKTYLDLLEEKLDPTAKEIQLMATMEQFLVNLTILENALSAQMVVESQSASDILDQHYNSDDLIYSIDD